MVNAHVQKPCADRLYDLAQRYFDGKRYMFQVCLYLRALFALFT